MIQLEEDYEFELKIKRFQKRMDWSENAFDSNRRWMAFKVNLVFQMMMDDDDVGNSAGFTDVQGRIFKHQRWSFQRSQQSTHCIVRKQSYWIISHNHTLSDHKLKVVCSMNYVSINTESWRGMGVKKITIARANKEWQGRCAKWLQIKLNQNSNDARSATFL